MMCPLFHLAHYHISPGQLGILSLHHSFTTLPTLIIRHFCESGLHLSTAQPHWQSGDRMQSRRRQEHSALRRHKQDCKFNNSPGASGQLGVDSRTFKCMCGGAKTGGRSGEGERKGALSTCVVRATNLDKALGRDLLLTALNTGASQDFPNERTQ